MSEAVEEELKPTGKPLTPAEWAEAVTLWELGEVTLKELSDKFGISQTGLSKGLIKRGAVKGSRVKEVSERITKTVLKKHEEEAVTSAEERQRKIDETKKQHYDWARFLGQEVVGRVIAARKDGRAYETELQNIKALRIAVASLGQIRQERYAILDADKAVNEDELPTLQIQDLTADEITKLQQADDDLEGEIVDLPAEIADIVEET